MTTNVSSAPTPSSSSSSTPLLFVSTPPPHASISLPPPTPPPRRRIPRCLAIFLLPGRLAVGVLSCIAGAGLARRQNASFPISTLSACLSVLLGQLLVTCAVRGVEVEGEEERMQWFDAIQAVAKIVDTFSSGLLNPSELKNVFLDTSLLRMLHHCWGGDYVNMAYSRPLTNLHTLITARYYLDYAMATYGFFLLSITGILHPNYNMLVEGARGLDVVKYMLALTDEQILASRLDGEAINVPRHFVALDDTHKAIVVAIRGTNSISDIITDLLCGNEPFAGGYAHCGMKKAAESLYIAILPTLRKAINDYPNYTIVITGHSLGAGVAILLTKILLMNNFTYVKCYAIAPCPVFGPMHKVDEEWSGALECFINADDLVAKLCLSSARNLVLEMEAISNLAASPAQKKQIVNQNDTNALRQLMMQQSQERSALDARHEEVEQLYIPCLHGVHWLLPEEDAILNRENEDDVAPAYRPTKRYSSYIMRPRYFERLLVTPPCVSAHFLSSYTAAFAGLDLPSRQIVLPPVSPNYTRSWYSNELG